MDWLPRIIIVLGSLMVVVGGLAAVVGGYQAGTYDCTSGDDTVWVSLLGPNESVESGNAVPFEDLSAEERSTFLDVLGDENNITYRDEFPPALFEDIRVVAYRGEQYRVHTGYVDVCGPPAYVTLLEMWGTALALGGVGLLVPAVVWQRARLGTLLR